MDVAAAIGAVLELAGLRVGDRLAYVEGHRSGLRVRHQPAGAEDARELADYAHLVGRRDRDVEVEEALLDPRRQVRRSDDVGACFLELAKTPEAAAHAAGRSAGCEGHATSTPIERAVPAITFIASSTSRAFRSGIFASAMERSCACESRPTFSRFGSPEPFSMESASLIRTAAGGVFVMNVKERSSKTVISTGVMRPFSCAVCALNALQNSMMLTPCWPSAGPTGGAGLAWPPGICSLISVRIFFAISRSSSPGRSSARRAPGARRCRPSPSASA